MIKKIGFRTLLMCVFLLPVFLGVGCQEAEKEKAGVANGEKYNQYIAARKNTDLPLFEIGSKTGEQKWSDRNSDGFSFSSTEGYDKVFASLRSEASTLGWQNTAILKKEGETVDIYQKNKQGFINQLQITYRSTTAESPLSVSVSRYVFPEYFPAYPNAYMSAFGMTIDGYVFTAKYVSRDSQKQVLDWYSDYLGKNGWSVNQGKDVVSFKKIVNDTPLELSIAYFGEQSTSTFSWGVTSGPVQGD